MIDRRESRGFVRIVATSTTRRGTGPRRDHEDHEDHETYAVSVPPGSGDAEAWARATFEGAPAPVRAVLVLGWRHVLRLRLATVGAHVLGWALERRRSDGADGPSEAVLTARSRSMTATLTFVVDGDELSVTGRRLVSGTAARVAWAGVRPVHRIVLPRALGAAVRRGP